ncbi:hypothetical protein GCM10008986_07090 [Salinibacillus aidingensis]|uniref:Uncharacterized protein n=1 Tax=Salinibacillus aidingensis TaxID=237684 RepID=A0ABN1AUZ7_9BACI
MREILGIYLAVSFILAGCSSSNQQDSINNEENSRNEQGNEELEVIAEDLNVPWSIEKLNNTFYLTERPGTMSR